MSIEEFLSELGMLLDRILEIGYGLARIEIKARRNTKELELSAIGPGMQVCCVASIPTVIAATAHARSPGWSKAIA